MRFSVVGIRALVVGLTVSSVLVVGVAGLARATVSRAAVPADDFAWPATGFISQNATEHLAAEGQRAIDIASFAKDVPVGAARAGSVVAASSDGNTRCHSDDAKSNGYGNYVVLKHASAAGTLYTLYGHLSSVAVKRGQHVQLGSKLGTIGQTGCATGPHVHFAIGTCATVSGSCTVWNAPDPNSGTAQTGAKVTRGDLTGGSYPQLGGSGAATPGPKPAARGSFVPVASWSYVDHNREGDATLVDVKFGSFQYPDSAMNLPSGGARKGLCAVDPERDFVAPGVLTLTNANESFAQRVRAGLFAVDRFHSSTGSSRDASIFDVEAYYSDGPTCESVTRGTFSDGQNSFGLVSASNLRPHQSISTEFYIIVHGVRNPDSPDGDINFINGIGFTPSVFGYTDESGSGPHTITDWSGPADEYLGSDPSSTALTHAMPFHLLLQLPIYTVTGTTPKELFAAAKAAAKNGYARACISDRTLTIAPDALVGRNTGPKSAFIGPIYRVSADSDLSGVSTLAQQVSAPIDQVVLLIFATTGSGEPRDLAFVKDGNAWTFRPKDLTGCGDATETEVEAAYPGRVILAK